MRKTNRCLEVVHSEILVFVAAVVAIEFVVFVAELLFAVSVAVTIVSRQVSVRLYLQLFTHKTVLCNYKIFRQQLSSQSELVLFQQHYLTHLILNYKALFSSGFPLFRTDNFP